MKIILLERLNPSMLSHSKELLRNKNLINRMTKKSLKSGNKLKRIEAGSAMDRVDERMNDLEDQPEKGEENKNGY